MKFKLFLAALPILVITACAPVGPDFVKPETELPPEWLQSLDFGVNTTEQDQPRWWLSFNDPVLNNLIEKAWQQNNTLELAGLRVLEAKAQLGIAQGSRYPQSQIAAGSNTYVSPAENLGGTSNYWQHGLGLSASWEIDFWGRFRRGIESADAIYLASIASRDQVFLLLTAQVVTTYTVIRINEEQLRIAKENVVLQQRSFDIASVLYKNGSDSELDMQQAHTLLLSTQATIPGFEVSLQQARNAMSTLLGKAPGVISALSDKAGVIPALPEEINIGLPADLLRRRPDVRQAELQAMAQNAQVGMAEADLYPSFSLTGAIGLAAGGPAGSSFGDMFSNDGLTFSVGPSFVWPFFNYGRIRNNIRVQDARLQQSLVNYSEVAIQAAQEAEDAMVAFIGTRKQNGILVDSVTSAKRSNELSMLRYKEGFSDYQRVLDAQQALFSQQQKLVGNQGSAVLNLVNLYTAMGGGWEPVRDRPLISDESTEQMTERTNWGEILESDQQ